MAAGTVGVLWMLVWLGFNSFLQHRGFWAAENLMATAFDRNATLAPRFTWATCGGLALYILIYELLGIVFALATRRRAPRNRVLLFGMLFGVAWYYFSFRWMFQFALPLVALLHVEQSTMLGHVLYGAILGRYPTYVDRLMGVAPAIAELPAPADEAADATQGEASEVDAGEPAPVAPPTDATKG